MSAGGETGGTRETDVLRLDIVNIMLSTGVDGRLSLARPTGRLVVADVLHLDDDGVAKLGYRDHPVLRILAQRLRRRRCRDAVCEPNRVPRAPAGEVLLAVLVVFRVRVYTIRNTKTQGTCNTSLQ